MSEVALCPECREPLLAYECEMGIYSGCNRCGWMGQPVKVSGCP